MYIFRLAIVTSLLQCVTPFPMYQKNIPNGEIVPSPCESGQLWPGVGHFKDVGSGERNPFGVWTKELCQKDSDADGRTNGEELGDPDCTWTQGGTPKTKQGLSHPGICEPITSTMCQQKKVIWGQYTTQKDWLAQICKTESFQCPAMQEPGE
ncbi:unnamed protein product [Candidula unifasciata]|uniref:Temptin Cys/Cys disulfide domain-containing protein n=1 Tax=Candidula unifasciata TaxID=100452 RepID=A0A8S3ZW70_9EUPU|nr:unnamed protein product [Candidula unifasciata]